MKTAFLAVVNPAAGSGRCGKLVHGALERLRAQHIELEVAESRAPGHASELARQAYRNGFRRFVAVGGDGTVFEIVNGLFPEALAGERPVLAFLPLGTGNSFLRDFTAPTAGRKNADVAEQAIRAILAGRVRACDLIRLTHESGTLYYINILAMGFGADAAEIANRRFKRWGEAGYLLGLFTCLARLRPHSFPLRIDGEPDIDSRPGLFVSFNNSKFTGGKMMIAPLADTNDGLIEYVHWGAIGRLALLRNLHTLYDGTHIRHPLAWRRAVRRVDFELDGPVNVMIDGESLSLHCRMLEAVPSAIEVMI